MMMKKIFLSFILLFVTTAFAAPPSQSVKRMSTKQRLERLESMMDSQTLVDIMFQLQTLQKEVTKLRGKVEEFNHQASGVKQRQRDLFLDLDRRLQKIENAMAGGVAIGGAGDKAAAGDPAQEQTRYQEAFNLLKQGKYKNAVNAFRSFLAAYPKSEYADNAQYWLGEVNYVNRNYKVAVIEFTKVVEDFPNSPKVADAMLKAGYSYYEMGDWGSAKTTLQNLRKKFPKTTAGHLAVKRLKRIKKEGH